MKRSSWSDYQKEIADDKYYYVRSCIRQNFFPGSEKAFLNMLQKDLGRDVFDDPLHTSCTGIGYHSDIVPLDTIMTVVARQFALMTDAGYENFISSCITSFGIYTEILATWEEFPEKEEQTREYLYKATGREFRKPKSLAHTSDIVSTCARRSPARRNTGWSMLPPESRCGWSNISAATTPRFSPRRVSAVRNFLMCSPV